jgi:hypothetical protein
VVLNERTLRSFSSAYLTSTRESTWFLPTREMMEDYLGWKVGCGVFERKDRPDYDRSSLEGLYWMGYLLMVL